MVKMLKCIYKQIKDELEKSDEYSMCAIKYKDDIEHEHLYKTYVKLATQEVEHADALSEDMAILVSVYNKKEDTKEDISILYDFIKENVADCESKVKVKLEMAKKTTY
jgi:hypothetical protein